MQRPIMVCIDDDLNALLGYQSLLWNHGYNPLISTSGRQGLELVNSLPIDGVLLDFQMPEMDGGMVAIEIKKTKPHVPVMMLTGYGSLPEAILKHVDAFFAKGGTPHELLVALDAMLNSRKSICERSLSGVQSKAA